MLKDFNHMEHLNYICVVADKLNELSREKNVGLLGKNCESRSVFKTWIYVSHTRGKCPVILASQRQRLLSY